MSAPEIIVAGLAYVIFGMIVAETEGLTLHPITVMFWPIVVLSALFGKHN